MSTGLDRIEWGRFARTGVGFTAWRKQGLPRFLQARFVWLPVVLLAAAGGWLVLPAIRGGIVPSEPAQPAVAAIQAAPPPAASVEPAPQGVAYDPATAEAITPEQPTALDKLKIYSQSWRRGGLGSNALVTFTLRNNNDHAVKDVEIACAFARRDGSHLTDRTRRIPGTIAMRSRRTFAHLHVGFININANKAKCALVSAGRA